ncbi:T9SS type A sorting domain-containing protein [Pontibacter cellulosilyticus]|uniref:T9SS type A sorting domain-containing protein n=1 Tax=Pontibacter cellulosilyticus TaxID=1720253 RepID=A0A923N9Y2_9BACT|nr:T9SS type A sorting domain-containing protein [Pontibacter cellulosilyticus]MBC5994051.1 T9SS type A sorting domain-containing protein [Pontibacter cellulosilyticus]
MKNIYLSIILSLIVVFGASAQTIVHHENFSGEITGVWTNVTGAWVIAPANDAAVSTLSFSSKEKYARTDNAVTTATKTLILRESISTKNISSLFITWQQYRNPRKVNSALTEPVKAYYSVDGGATRHEFYTTTNTVNSQWNHVNGGTPIQLPQAALGYDDVRIDIEIVYTKNNGDSNPYYAVDDVTLTGTLTEGYSTFNWANRPLDENPFLVSGPTSTSPYVVDGVTMRWSVAMSSDVSFEVSKVDNTNFKAGTKSFALIQTGATATTGSTIQLSLDKAVRDLSFTLFDVDIATDQFKDRINIVGYNNGVAVQLKKSKVKTTSYNQFTSTAPTAFSGLITNDNTSAEGDVVITFSEPVTRVVIEYRNDSQVRNSNGRQGIAIHNLSWRNEMTISSLPVELISFRGAALDNTAKLNWSTATEKNNKHFDVEHSQDGKAFKKIGTVAGAGNSSSKLNYTFTDQTPGAGVNYYRLLQTDFDGKSTYSNIVAVEMAGSMAIAPKSKLYPTAATDVVNIDFAGYKGTIQVQVIDATGKAVKQLAVEPAQVLVLPVQDLVNGVYFVSVTDGEHHETLRFVKR